MNGGGGGTPGGSTGNMQYKSGSSFAGDTYFNTDGAGNISITGSLAIIPTTSIPGLNTANGTLIHGGGYEAFNWSETGTNTRRLKTNYYFLKQISITDQEAFAASATDNGTPTYEGEVVEGVIDTGVQLFDLVCLYDGGSTWYQVRQSDPNYVTRMLGIYVGNNYVLLEGNIVAEDNQNTYGPYVQNLVQGGAVYVKESTTTGEIDCTIPTGGFIRRLGHCYYQSTNATHEWIFKFRPSNDWNQL